MEKKEILKTIGRRIREERKEQGFSQEGFALHIELDRSYYGGIERGERNVTIFTLCQIAIALGKDIAFFTKDIPLKSR